MNCVAYYRVSTVKQGVSGLGLDGQREAVRTYAESAGMTIVAEHTEVVTGKAAKDNPTLAKAISHTKRIGGILLIAKLDRLARNVAFVSALMESKVKFVACDNPHATPFTIHILAAVAEFEASAISSRTKTALASYKASGRVSRRILAAYPEGVPTDVMASRSGKLGSSLPECRDNLSAEARRKGVAAASAVASRSAREAYEDLAPMILELSESGLSLREIASRLNAENQTTRSGKPFNHVQVARILERFSLAV